MDRAVPISGITETEFLINRFPIDLVLELGADFTERTTYTGIYNISGLGFDMSFRVQCFVNYTMVKTVLHFVSHLECTPVTVKEIVSVWKMAGIQSLLVQHAFKN